MASLALTLPASSSLLLSASAKGDKKGVLDWFSEALEKEHLYETDPILNKVDGKNGAPPKPSPAGKKPAPKKQGGGFFGLGKK